MNPSTLTPDTLRDNAQSAVNEMANQAANSTDNAIRSTQRATHDLVDSAAGKMKAFSEEAAPMLNRAADRIANQASSLAQRGIDAVHQGSDQLRHSADQAGQRTIGYIKEEPLKAMLIAGATGAVLMALVSLLSQGRHRA